MYITYKTLTCGRDPRCRDPARPWASYLYTRITHVRESITFEVAYITHEDGQRGS